MSGFNWERNARFGRAMVFGGAIGFWALVTGVPAHAALSESGFPAIQIRQEVRPQEPSVSSNQVAIAQYNTGHRADALRMWRTHAEQGDAEAQFTLGVLYNRGDGGLPKDMIEAVHWYRKAAEQGHVVAQYNMGILCATGTGLAKDVGAAIDWWRMAAMQGHAEAQFNLGLFYAEGTGVSKNSSEAVKWWSMAAGQGQAAAQFNLGLMYMKGEGIDENQDEAVKLWRQSANQGFTQAITVLKVLHLEQ